MSLIGMKTITREEACDLAGEDDLLFYDDLDGALVGIVRGWIEKSPSAVALYDYEMIIACLMKRGSSREEAEEHFEFNTIGAYVGPKTPMVMVSSRG